MWCSSTDLTNVKHPRSGLLYTLYCVRWPPNQVYLIGERSSAIFKAHGIAYPEPVSGSLIEYSFVWVFCGLFRELVSLEPSFGSGFFSLFWPLVESQLGILEWSRMGV